jgi:hypothetical protein
MALSLSKVIALLKKKDYRYFSLKRATTIAVQKYSKYSNTEKNP